MPHLHFKSMIEILKFVFSGQIARSTAQTSFVMFLRLFIQAATLIFISHILTPTEFAGFTAAAALSIIFGSISSFGAHIYILAHVSKNPRNSTEAMSKALPITLGCGTLLTIAWVGITYFLQSEETILGQSIHLIAISEILVQPLILLSSSELISRRRTSYSQLITIFPIAIRVIFLAALFYQRSDNSVQLICAAWLASSAVTLTMLILTNRKIWPPPSQWKHPKRRELKHLFGYAATNFTTITSMELDKPLAVKMLTPENAGMYAIYSRLAYASIQPVSALILSSLPKLFKDEHHHKSRRLVKLIFTCSLAYGMVICACIQLSLTSIMNLFSDVYTQESPSLNLFFFALPALALKITGINIIMTTGSPWTRAKCELPTIGIQLLACTTGGLYNDLNGFIAGYVLSEWFAAGMNWAYIVKKHRAISWPGN